MAREKEDKAEKAERKKVLIFEKLFAFRKIIGTQAKKKEKEREARSHETPVVTPVELSGRHNSTKNLQNKLQIV